MLGMMGDKNRERGAMMGRSAVMQAIAQELLGGAPNPGQTPGIESSPSELKDHGAAVMRALQAGDVEAFTAGLQRFIIAMEEVDDDSPFDLEAG